MSVKSESKTTGNYKRVEKYSASIGFKTSTPIRSGQVIIMSSTEQLISSDESATIDVTTYENSGAGNPWGDVDVDKIPIEILNESSSSTKVKSVEKAPPVYFHLLTEQERLVVGMQLSLKLDLNKHIVHYENVSAVCRNPVQIAI